MTDSKILDDLGGRLTKLEQAGGSLRMGTITNQSPLSVQLALPSGGVAADYTYEGVTALNGVVPGVGDKVACMVTRNIVLVLGIIGGTPSLPPSGQTYTASNLSTPDRDYNTDATSINELADVLGTLLSDLRTAGFIE